MGKLVLAFNPMKRYIVKAMNLLQAVHYNWGLEFYEKGDLARAIYQLCNALAVNSARVECYAALARALADKEHGVSAIAQYQATLRLRPEDPGIHFNLGVVLYYQGERKLGFKELNAALHIYRQKGQNAEAWNVEQFLSFINLSSLE